MKLMFIVLQKDWILQANLELVMTEVPVHESIDGYRRKNVQQEMATKVMKVAAVEGLHSPLIELQAINSSDDTMTGGNIMNIAANSSGKDTHDHFDMTPSFNEAKVKHLWTAEVDTMPKVGTKFDIGELSSLVDIMKKELDVEGQHYNNPKMQELFNSPTSKALSKALVQSNKLLLDLAIDQPNFSDLEEDNEISHDTLGYGDVQETEKASVLEEHDKVLEPTATMDHFQVVWDRIRALKGNGGLQTSSNKDDYG